MTGSGFESFTSRSVDHELVPRDPKEEMAVRLALRCFREATARRHRSDLQRRESIAFAQPVLGSGVAASPEAVRSVWRPNPMSEVQPLRWPAEQEAWSSSDDVMAWRARGARQQARDVVKALATVDVGDAESHSPAPP
ncbi:ATP-dependent DNA helicase Q4 [Hordeum vulgare]|nr:ATP-dependent DNA helicase Q4 [Hordeum vulgare]